MGFVVGPPLDYKVAPHVFCVAFMSHCESNAMLLGHMDMKRHSYSSIPDVVFQVSYGVQQEQYVFRKWQFSCHALSTSNFLGSKHYQIPKVNPVAKALGTLAHPRGAGGGDFCSWQRQARKTETKPTATGMLCEHFRLLQRCSPSCLA